MGKTKEIMAINLKSVAKSVATIKVAGNVDLLCFSSFPYREEG